MDGPGGTGTRTEPDLSEAEGSVRATRAFPETALQVAWAWRAARIKVRFFLSYPQEISPLHSFYTVEPQFAVALIFSLPQSACS
jgi:hypothetical protein